MASSRPWSVGLGLQLQKDVNVFTFWSLRCILYRWYITSSRWCKTWGEAGWAENGIEISSKRQMGVRRRLCKITYTTSKTLQYAGVRKSWLFQDCVLEERIPSSPRRSLLPWVGGQGVQSKSSMKAVWNTAAKEKWQTAHVKTKAISLEQKN